MSETLDDLPKALRTHASWLINAGADDTSRVLAQMDGTDDEMRILRAAIATEKAKPTEQQRVSRLKPMEAKLRKFSEAARTALLATKSPLVKRAEELKSAKNSKPENTGPTTPEVIPAPKAVLTDASKALEKLRSVIVKHEDTFHAQTLGPRLQIGLQCLKAYDVFAVKDQGKKGQGRKPKNQLTRELISEGGFKGWLSSEAQWLKEPTAYKYMTAVRGLGLDHAATEKQVAAALKLLIRKGPVTITSLCAAALDAIGPPAPEPPTHEQQEFNFLRQNLTAFREQSENICRLKSQLDAYPDFKRAATARVYSMLWELTGTHWQPSDEPDSIASIDPDAITI